MWSAIKRFFQTGPDRPLISDDPEHIRRAYERRRWSVFLSVTIGYGLFYACRVNFSVVKKPMLDAGILDTTQMGVIGAAMLAIYAVGKFLNGFMADHCNIQRFMSTGLLVSALVNLVLGSTTLFAVFAVLWGLNGWFQSVGSAPSVVAMSHWFSTRERGTRYGIWSISHSLGEGLTFAFTAALVAGAGWEWGFWGPGLVGVVAALILFVTLSDRPQAHGLPPVWEYKREQAPEKTVKAATHELQREVIRHPGVWVLGLASASMYVARYGMNDWGVLFLQEGKGYSLAEAGAVFAAYPLAALVGSVSSGLVSDFLFGSRRNVPVLMYGLVQVAALTAFWLIPPGHRALDVAALVVFGFGLGGLLVFLGGLMAVDIVSQRAAGAAMGLVGMFSYLGAAAQDTVTGWLLDVSKLESALADGTPGAYSFDTVFTFWIGASVLSLLLASLLWRVRAQG
jgi:OPA family sugar phosphate sensor protein UhpC-like MFS transporter